MAAYAALVSLLNTLNNIQIHPRVSAFLDNKHIKSLHKLIDFLLDFIESREEEVLLSRIASAAHAVEDLIESHVVEQIHAGSSSLLDLERAIKFLNYVAEKVMEFKETNLLQHTNSMPTTSSKPLTTITKNVMVGLDEELIHIMDVLTGQQTGLQIVTIVGMGGIGKTTLARNVYENLLIIESFDVRAWVTVSQEYSVKNIFSELLSCIKDRKMNKSLGAFDCETDLEADDHQLGVKLYQSLFGRRYLIVLDDIWNIEAWDKIKNFFPNNDSRSRIVITSRISNVATHLSSSSFEMNFLDEGNSWRLFCWEVFQEEGCPLELEDIGKKIVTECKGLPLSIVVIGGLLRNSITREYWEDINSNLKSRSDEHCLSILSLSYNHLPAHLKPCFLYMGVFPGDEKIVVSRLIKLFVAEGFLRPRKAQTLEEVAEDYLKDLANRNLILVGGWRWNGTIKYCKMHDLVRELCLKISKKEKFFYVMGASEVPYRIGMKRRIILDNSILNQSQLPYASLTRTFKSIGGPLPFKFRLLRVLSRVGFDFEPLKAIFQQVNLRYLTYNPYGNLNYSRDLLPGFLHQYPYYGMCRH